VARPTWIAFDLNGTLLDPAALLGAQHAELGRQALDHAVMQAMADTVTGHHRPFPDYLRAALKRELQILGADHGLLDAAMQRAAALPAFVDAKSALKTLSRAGYQIAVVTNSGGPAASSALNAADLGAFVDAVIGADEVGAYKPHPRVYAHAASELGVAPEQICLIAAHAWDVLGAQRAGWRAAWVAHREQHLLSTVPEPTLRATSLEQAADLLAAL